MPKVADRTYFTPASTLWFCGREVVSRGIALWTCSWRQYWEGQLISHCGVIAQDQVPGGYSHYESTTLKAPEPFYGVQKNDPWERIDQYQGRVYLSRPRIALTLDQSDQLSTSLEAFLGTPYDMRQALLAGTRWIKRHFDADRGQVFCDELISMALMDSGKVAEWAYSPSDMTPASLVRWLTHSGMYSPLVRLK